MGSVPLRDCQTPFACLLLSCLFSIPLHAQDGEVRIEWFRLQAPGDTHGIQQASDLHYGRLGGREGLWAVCDRNGRESAGRIYFFSPETLQATRPEGKIVADEEFVVLGPAEGWPAFYARPSRVGREILDDIRRRTTPVADRGDEPFLDLEAITIGSSPGAPHEKRLFVAAEEPYSVILELALGNEGRDGPVRPSGGEPPGVARLVNLYAYGEPAEHQGTARNDGLEGLAFAGKPGQFYFAEEGTRSHTQDPKPLLMFRDPILGRGELNERRLEPDPLLSQALSAAVRKCRKGESQTLNGLAVLRDGRLLAVDRNGGLILRIDPARAAAEPWVNLYDLAGKNLRELLAGFPQRRRMPYISIEGIALDGAGALWLVDDPAMPEGWRESCLLRITGLKP